MKTLNNLVRTTKIGLVGIGLTGILSGCAEINTEVPEFDQSKIPEEYRVLPKEFTCNYWKDENNDEIPQFNEVSGLKKVFNSDEPITIIKKIEDRKGQTIKIICYPDNIFSKLELGVKGYGTEDVTIPNSNYYLGMYITPGKLERGKYKVEFIQKRRFLEDIPFEEISFKVR